MKKEKRGRAIKKKSIQIIIALAILMIGILVVYAVVDFNKSWHSPDEIIVSIGGCDVTLQDAISNEWLKGIVTPTYCLSESEFPKVYHLASEIIVTIDVYTLTLQDAFDRNYFKGGTIDSSTSLPSKGHFANEIYVLVDSISMSLQDAINTGELSCVPDCVGKECGDDGCGGSCGTCGLGYICSAGSCVLSGECIPGQTRTKDCDPLDTICRDYHDVADTCSPSGYWTASCTSYTNVADETACGTGNWCINGICQWRVDCLLEGQACFFNSDCCSGDCSFFKCKAGSGTVICTELYNTGFLDEETYKLDVEYGSSYFSQEVFNGYQMWAIPVVKFMRENPESVEYILPLVKSFTEEGAYHMGERKTGNEIGELFLEKGVPLFERVGVLINEPDWKSLFDKNPSESRIDLIVNIFNNIFESDDKHDELVRDYFTKDRLKVTISEALEKAEGSDMEFARALLENLEREVEEIEAMVEALEN